jgi:hypothetical protein
MQIFIKGISLHKNKTITTINDITDTYSTKMLYTIINNMFGISQDEYYLQFKKILSFSNETLAECGIGKESTVHLHFRIGKACKINN